MRVLNNNHIGRNMKSLFHILILLLIFNVSASSLEKSQSVYYKVIADETKVYRYENFRTAKMPIATLDKGNVVKIIEKLDTKMKVALKDGKVGFVYFKQFVKLSDYKNSLMNEIEILSDLDEIDAIFLVEDNSSSLLKQNNVKYIEKSFMTEEYVVNLDIFELERLIRINKYKRR